jgi:L-ribulose-5-phosphate 4-epimerase
MIMLESLKSEVCDMNLALVEEGLVTQTWGNASAIDRTQGIVAIKPSGVHYGELTPEHIVMVDLDGVVVEGTLKPSVDLPAHLVLYRAFPQIGAVVHTHSHFATCFAQARRPIPCLGTTHADYFYGEVPVTAALTAEEVADGYEQHIGDLIVRCIAGLDPMAVPGVLCAGHAPFVWGHGLTQAVENAAVLEELARMAFHTLLINPAAAPLEPHLLDKHFLRKHGQGAYYGQKV